VERLRRLVITTFPEDPYTAKKIVQGESSFKPHVCGPKNSNNTIDCGLWQINDIHLPELNRLGLNRFNPEDATKFARVLYERNGGWGDWVYYTHHLAIR